MRKLVVFLLLFFVIIDICVNTYAKYIFENTTLVANINIDGEPPKIEFINVTNTNEKYNKYANKTHTITIEFRVKERNIKENKIEDYISVSVNDTPFYPRGYKLIKEETIGEYIYYKYILTNLSLNGILKMTIGKGAIVDIANQISEKVIFDTGIMIDNIAPVVSFSQEEIEEGKINAKIKTNEQIREVNGWNRVENNTLLNKEFKCNVLYPFFVTDFAGNSTNIDVKIDKATNISFRYGSVSESPMNQWEFGTGENQIVGKKVIEKDEQLKIEAISLYWEGADKDFMQIMCYAHTYWGEGYQGICYTYETRYNHGYNPKENQYATLANGTIINLDGKLTLLLGGEGMNIAGNRGYGGSPIPEEVANQHPFGITALKIKLKENSEDSIVYQVWVRGEGWLEPVSDGEETTFSHDKPIGAYRMSLIPKTEKQYLIDLWKKDVGTNNMK